jgi:hypothetical protein
MQTTTEKKANWRDITTFEQVCEAAGENPRNFDIPENVSIRQRGVILFSKLQLICEVFKQGVVLDYADSNQYKYYPWGRYNPASGGFSLNVVYDDVTSSVVGARLSVDSEEKSEHIWEHFNAIISEYWQEK